MASDNRTARLTRRWAALGAVLGVLVVAGLFVHPHHPHFAAESLYGFWPLFGLLGGTALALAGGLALRPLTRWEEDGHDG
ncbi:hypothetical protein NNJEOMEG_00383 [Fundidesulfovibrio magnetotacticus]|uniref:Uncharacterized protein n=1 Tax=Fundidesulfovibrio magnetotacticus TaxID=2730080 RepID=A0A6V8LQE2_9BACT|nr:hypothetical protein [Fundidesulfovibrio magnetotacticus]GFK92558.1 hypothetical protein NNJEOMEG_00383 [Fundidesulfovibrio magnetotacticus]